MSELDGIVSSLETITQTLEGIKLDVGKVNHRVDKLEEFDYMFRNTNGNVSAHEVPIDLRQNPAFQTETHLPNRQDLTAPLGRLAVSASDVTVNMKQ